MAEHAHTLLPTLPPTRRRLLAGSGLAATLAALALPAAAAAVAPAPAEPLVTLCAEWRACEDAHIAMCDRQEAVRAGFVQRHGEILGSWDGPTMAAWRCDPLKGELDALTARCSELSTQSGQLMNAIEDTPAMSMDGVRAKLSFLAGTWTYIERPGTEPDYQEVMTLAVLREVIQFMDAGAGA